MYSGFTGRSAARNKAVMDAMRALSEDRGASVALGKLSCLSKWELRTRRGRVVRRICQGWDENGQPADYVMLNASARQFIKDAQNDRVPFDRVLARRFLAAVDLLLDPEVSA